MRKIVPEKQVFQHHFPISWNNDLQPKARKSNDTKNITSSGVSIIPNPSLGLLSFILSLPPCPISVFISSPGIETEAWGVLSLVDGKGGRRGRWAQPSSRSQPTQARHAGWLCFSVWKSRDARHPSGFQRWIKQAPSPSLPSWCLWSVESAELVRSPHCLLYQGTGLFTEILSGWMEKTWALCEFAWAVGGGAGPPASTSYSACLAWSLGLSHPFVCGLWPSLGHRLESKYKKKRQSTFQWKSPRKLMWLLYRNGSNKGRKEYCFYSFWDIKHLENVIDWQGLIYHLSHSLHSLLLPTTHRQTLTGKLFSPLCFPFFFSLRDLDLSSFCEAGELLWLFIINAQKPANPFNDTSRSWPPYSSPLIIIRTALSFYILFKC